MEKSKKPTISNKDIKPLYSDLMVQRIAHEQDGISFAVGVIVDGIVAGSNLFIQMIIGDKIIFNEKDSKKIFNNQDIYIVGVNAIVAKIKSEKDLKQEETIMRGLRSANKTTKGGK